MVSGSSASILHLHLHRLRGGVMGFCGNCVSSCSWIVWCLQFRHRRVRGQRSFGKIDMVRRIRDGKIALFWDVEPPIYGGVDLGGRRSRACFWLGWWLPVMHMHGCWGFGCVWFHVCSPVLKGWRGDGSRDQGAVCSGVGLDCQGVHVGPWKFSRRRRRGGLHQGQLHIVQT